MSKEEKKTARKLEEQQTDPKTKGQDGVESGGHGGHGGNDPKTGQLDGTAGKNFMDG